METGAQLKIQLKELRLLSVLENLDARIKQALENRESYIDFLGGLIQDEIDRRKYEKRERRIRQACFGRLKYLKEFDFSFNPNINRQLIQSFETCDFIKNHENIIICGPTGVGKTHIAKGIGIEACYRGYRVIFSRVFKMLEEIHSGKADATLHKKMKKYIKPDLLILDDWGFRPFPDNLLDILNEIISERYEVGSVIITSNRNLTNWNELFSEKVIASALLDRLLHRCKKIIIKGKSFRTGTE